MTLLVGLLLFPAFTALIFLRRQGVKPSSPADVIDPALLAVRYRPMSRLLNGSDFETLNANGHRSVLRRMRAQRRRIFRGYLRCLRRDHAMLCSRIRSLMVEAHTDRPDMALALFRMEALFQLLVFGASLKLVMHAVGVDEINVSGLLGSFEQVRRQFEMLALPAGAAA